LAALRGVNKLVPRGIALLPPTYTMARSIDLSYAYLLQRLILLGRSTQCQTYEVDPVRLAESEGTLPLPGPREVGGVDD